MNPRAARSRGRRSHERRAATAAARGPGRRLATGPARRLVVLAIGLGVSVYAWTRIFHTAHALDAVVWFVAAILAHDAIFLPFYRLCYEIAHRLGRVEHGRRRRTPILRHLVTPTVISAFLFIAWVPLIVRPASSAATYQAITGVSSSGYLGRWALITAGLFWLSLVIYVIRALRAGDLPELPEPLPRSESAAPVRPELPLAESSPVG